MYAPNSKYHNVWGTTVVQHTPKNGTNEKPVEQRRRSKLRMRNGMIGIGRFIKRNRFKRSKNTWWHPMRRRTMCWREF